MAFGRASIVAAWMRDMSALTSHDLTLSLVPEPPANRPRAPLAAFVPITVAVIGVAFILFGGIRAHDGAGTAVATSSAPALVDPVVTGSIGSQHDVEFLDR